MSEMKLRIWDKTYKRFIFCSDLMIDFLKDDNGALQPTLVFSKDTFDGHCGLGGYDEAELYAGLKDKNKKEYYEGDIIQQQEGMKGKFVIVQMLGGLSIHPLRNLGQNHNELIAQPCNDAQAAQWLSEQVNIGNIHENPELLEERI